MTDADALRLEQRTELNRGRNYGYSFDPLTQGVQRVVTVRSYGGDLVEVGYSSVQTPNPNEPEREKGRGKGGAMNEATRQAHMLRSVRRSKAQVRRKCMAGGLDHLLTLTYADNQKNVDEAYRHLKRFIRLVREHLPDWKYCAVHELQKRGAVHFHLAVRGFQDVRLLRRCWVAAAGAGNIDVQAPRGRGSVKWSLPRLAGYLSKYISKGATDSNGRQRYRVAEGIEVPRDTFIYVAERGRNILQELFDSFGLSIAYQWDQFEGVSGWACSWET